MAFNLGNLPGIDPSILMANQHAMSDAVNQGLLGYQNGLKMKQQRTEMANSDADRARAEADRKHMDDFKAAAEISVEWA